MKVDDIVINPPPPPEFQFYTVLDLAKFLKTKPMNVYKWRELGRIPPKWQAKIEKMTKGKFKASIDDLGDS